MSGRLQTTEPTLQRGRSFERDEQARLAYPVQPHLTRWQLLVKRAFDVVVCLVLFPLFIGLSAIIGIAIKLDTEGPILYKQGRIGKDGKAFLMYKFRSMRKNAEEMRQSLDAMNEANGPVFKIKRDPRVTRVGVILRKTSLDELPQILNVLKGEMSLVGPRPPLPDEVAKYSDYHFGRLAVTPGITCIWQVEGRSTISFDRWVELDLEYIRKQSFWLDIVLLLRTVVVVLRCTGAW